ncbi:MAG TPA: recombinase family protein [Thermoanaerobaculia bacterium]|jgi:DNA invertase Pin-like site-specific DNA recombinase|nr:recombinase family protein [Thermoanaerobaculia bacterium]
MTNPPSSPVPKGRFLAYLRVSTPRQGEGVSLLTQREEIGKFAARQGLIVTGWYEEQTSAAKRGRPVFAEILRKLRRGEADGLIVHKVDRSTRNLKDWADLGELIDQGIPVYFSGDGLDLSSRSGRLAADIQAVIAANYVRNLREEAKNGIKKRLEQGLFPLPALSPRVREARENTLRVRIPGGLSVGEPEGGSMWYQEFLGRQSWTSLWNEYIVCTCGAIRPYEGQCLVCGQAKPDLEWTVIRSSDGTEHRLPPSFPGAEDRYEDYVYLEMLEREWLSPITDNDRFITFAEGRRPSPRAIVVLVFWTYFETRLERLLRAAMRNLPNTLTEDLLARYSSVGARLDRLYRAVFSSTYWADLKELGHPRVPIFFSAFSSSGISSPMAILKL